MAQGEKIIPVAIESEMQDAYIDYAMSVIVSRALPDVRDGLKPVHRRVLYGMLELGLAPNRPYKKSARIVGEVLGKYHPHGDVAVYDTLVRMVQNFSLRYPLVDGQGNFGSVDGDSPAAMRYTEARLNHIAESILEDLNKNTVDFQPNFDDSLQEPTVMPAKIPNLLVNGASGIAVGMATNMAPHNLSEVVEAICAYIDNDDIPVEGLLKYIKGPDFPTGGIIYGYDGVKDALLTGKGRVVVRGRASVESTKGGRERIIVTEIPYMVNKASLIENTAELVSEKKMEGISDIRDESDRDGMRIVFELKRDAESNVVLNNLYKHTQLQESFSVNNVALVKGRPRQLNVRDMIQFYVEHRHEVVTRRTKWELDEAEKRAHILEGLLIALKNLDAVIELIKKSKDPQTAQEGLIKKFKLSEIQAKAILDMRLQRLTGMEQQKIQDEYKELIKQITYLKSVLENKKLRMQIIKDELVEVKKKFGDARRTEIVLDAKDFSVEDMIADEDMVITISHHGYIKRTAVSGFRTQKRGGMGSTGATTREEDFVQDIFVASTHNYILFFTEKGKCYWLRVYEVPEAGKAAKGKPVQNLVNIEKDDRVKAFINVNTLEDENYIKNHFIIMSTRKGTVKKTTLEAYSNPRASGINAININPGDELIEALLTDGKSDIMIGARNGHAVRFPENTVRPMGRTATGVRGITLEGKEDEVIGMISVNRKDASILVVAEHGFGKRSTIEDYRLTNRGGKGVITMKITDKTGNIIALKEVVDTDDLMIITKNGTAIRMSVKSIREMGRATQGVRLIKVSDGDSIASIARVPADEDAEKIIPPEANGKPA